MSKKTEWITVKERLPNAGQWVLIYTPVKDKGLIEIAMLSAFEGFINPQMGVGSFENVTHWMAFPEEPK